MQQVQNLRGSPALQPGQSSFSGRAPHQVSHATFNNHAAGNTILGGQNIPVMSAPPPGAQPFSPTYDYYVDARGKTCKVLRQPEFVPPTKTEFRCSPLSGRRYTVQVPVQPNTPPQVTRFEWRCNAVTGEMYRVEVTIPQQSSQTQGQMQQPQSMPWSGQVPSSIPQPQQGATPQLAQANHPGNLHQQPGSQMQQQIPGDFDQQLQNKVKGIVQLCEGGITRKASRPLDFAKKGSAKWAKKATAENINLPLFVYGAISELESSMSGRSDPIPEGEFLAKLRHVKNVLDVCCLNSDSTDFKGYGWTIAKDYALKVEGEIEQKISNWEDLSGGVQTSQLVLAQMDHPKPIKTVHSDKSSDKKDDKSTSAKPRCTSYNTCKTEDKCNYEVNNPDKSCILKHECNWCKTNLRQSWKHQEWNCKKKN